MAKEKTKIAQARIPESFFDEIEKMAIKQRRKITEMVRILIEDGAEVNGLKIK